MNEPTPEAALRDIAARLQAMGVQFALVGGLAVSIRGEARFTRDVDLALIVDSDADAESIVYSLRDAGYVAIALVEHRDRPRLATARLASPSEIIIDLIVATCGIEREARGARYTDEDGRRRRNPHRAGGGPPRDEGVIDERASPTRPYRCNKPCSLQSEPRSYRRS